MKYRSLLAIYVLAVMTSGGAAAQTNYPDRPIHMIVGFPPGSQADTVARLYGAKLGEVLGKPVVVDNVLGAAGNIAADRVTKAAPDGYTLGFLGEGQMVINPGLYKLSYDPIKDLAPVSQVALAPNLLVVKNDQSASSVKLLADLARAQPGALTFASGGIGSSPHMAAELFRSTAGVDIRHIPYKGVVMAVPDLLAGRVTMMFSPIGIVLPLVREGKLKALAVTSSVRSSAATTVPTMAESGFPGSEFTGWYGLFAPQGTPASILLKLESETTKVVGFPDLKASLADLGVEAVGNSSKEFSLTIRSETQKWAKVIKDGGLKLD